MAGGIWLSQVAQRFFAAIGRVLVGRVRLLYVARFVNDDLLPAYDPLGLGPLKQTHTTNFTPPPGTMVLAPGSGGLDRGARFTISSPVPVGAGDPIGLGVVMQPFPADVYPFKLLATFSKPEGPHGAADGWAAVLHARAGDLPDSAPRDARISITLQSSFDTSANKPIARMNTVGGAPPGTPYPFPLGSGSGSPLPDPVFDGLFPNLGSDSRAVFSLEMYVDRQASLGNAQLRIQGIKPLMVPNETAHFEHRFFIHPFIPLTNQTTGLPNVIGAVGVQIAIAAGLGPSAVSVHDFRIIGMTARDRSWLSDWGGDNTGGVILALRRRLLDLAFRNAAAPRAISPSR